MQNKAGNSCAYHYACATRLPLRVGCERDRIKIVRKSGSNDLSGVLRTWSQASQLPWRRFCSTLEGGGSARGLCFVHTCGILSRAWSNMIYIIISCLCPCRSMSVCLSLSLQVSVPRPTYRRSSPSIHLSISSLAISLYLLCFFMNLAHGIANRTIPRIAGLEPPESP